MAAFARAGDAGCLVLFVSGRPPQWLRPVAEATDHHGIAIGNNGAVGYDLYAERTLERFPIAADVGLLAERGVEAAEVTAFGDMPNDLPMLAWAGTAYAGANAHPEVLAAMDLRCPSNDEDGVAQVLERFFGTDLTESGDAV